MREKEKQVQEERLIEGEKRGAISKGKMKEAWGNVDTDLLISTQVP